MPRRSIIHDNVNAIPDIDFLSCYSPATGSITAVSKW